MLQISLTWRKLRLSECESCTRKSFTCIINENDQISCYYCKRIIGFVTGVIRK